MKQLTKKLLLLLLATVTAVCLALGLAACVTDDDGDDGDGLTLSAPVITLNGNVISWEAVENATRYIVYEGDEQDGTNVATTSYTINKTAPGNYVYTVAAYSANANPKIGPKSNSVTYTVIDPNAIILSAPIITLSGNIISWEAVENATSYIVYEGDEEEGTPVNGTTYAINKTEIGNYVYTVAAYNEDAEPQIGPKSNSVTYTVEDGGKGEEITLSAPVITLEDNVISWNAVENATAYYVYEGDAAGELIFTTTYTINKTAPGDYTYTVAAYNLNANPQIGPKSNAVTYTIEPNRIDSPVVEIVGNALNWETVEGAVAYDIYKNGEKVATVEGFSYSIFGTILPTTYTIADAKDGDKFYVVAVSVGEDPADSKPSEEVIYKALGDTISATDSVYITSETKTINVTTTDILAGGAYKVVLKPNNIDVTGELSGIDSITVSGNTTNDAPFGAVATYDSEKGAYVATVVINGDYHTLYLNIQTMFEQVPIGFTVSLEDPYENNTVATYTLEETGSVEVVVPFGVGGYHILVNVPSGQHVLYLIAEDGDVGIIIINTTNSGLTYHDEGYYQSTSFTATSFTLAAFDRIDVKATITLETPDIVYANAPELTGDNTLYQIDIAGSTNTSAPAEPTLIKVGKVPNGNYIFVLRAVEGASLYVKLDNGSYQKLSSSGSMYSLNLTINDNTYLYIYSANERDGTIAQTITLIKAGDMSYDLSATEPAEDVLIGSSLASATVFNLINVSDGEYTLTVTGDYGMTFYAIVGESTYNISDYKSNPITNIYTYSTLITIEGQTSISIYTTGGLYLSTVTLEEYVVVVNPELTHGATGAQFKLTALYGGDASQTFTLVDVPNGTYTVVLTGFGPYEDWYNIKLIVGSQTIQICESEGGYLGDQLITINGETELTVAIYSAHVTLNLTIYLLAEGESLGGGDNNSLTVENLEVENGMWSKVDISKLPAGEYSISIYNRSGSGDPTYSLGFDDYLNEGAFTSFSGNPTANGTFEIPEGGESALWITASGISIIYVDVTIELIGGGDVAGGGSETSLVFDELFIMDRTTYLDVSSLQYGEYTVTLEDVPYDILNGYPEYYLATSASGDNEITLNEGNGFTGTITISSEGLYLTTSATFEYVTIKLEKIGGGDVAGGGSATSLTVELYPTENNTVIDVSSLQYGEYTVTLEGETLVEDWLGNSPTYYLIIGNDEIPLNFGNGYTCTITLNTDSVILNTSNTWEEVTIKFEKVGGGDVGGGGSVAGSSYDDPIVCDEYLGTFTAEGLQEAWFKLPATYMFGSEFTITFAAGVTVEIDGGYYKEPLTSGGMVEIDWLNGVMLHVVAPVGTACSFTISDDAFGGGDIGGGDAEDTLSTTQSVTVSLAAYDEDDPQYVVINLGASVSDDTTYLLKLTLSEVVDFSYITLYTWSLASGDNIYIMSADYVEYEFMTSGSTITLLSYYGKALTVTVELQEVGGDDFDYGSEEYPVEAGEHNSVIGNGEAYFVYEVTQSGTLTFAWSDIYAPGVTAIIYKNGFYNGEATFLGGNEGSVTIKVSAGDFVYIIVDTIFNDLDALYFTITVE